VRILATTNRDIRQVVAEGSFREDLFYRLNVFPLNILPLRERPDDILPIAKRLMMSYVEDGATVSFTASAMKVLTGHSWPGNVRELDNVVQRAMILRSGITVDDVDIRFEELTPVENANFDSSPAAVTNSKLVDESLSSDLKAREADIIISALRAKSSRKEVAEKLGISPRTLRYKLAKLRDAGVALPV
jgi:two-component system response regulator FlrC